MSKNYSVRDESTKMFIDLAIRSFDANWKCLLEIYDGDMRELAGEDEAMISLITGVIDHIEKHFEEFTQREGYRRNISAVDIEAACAALVSYSDNYRIKKSK